MTIRTLLSAVFLLIPVTASANDGFAGMSSTGLQFTKTEDVRMVREDLFLSTKRVNVRYHFHNDGDKSVQGEVIFPLPPIALPTLYYGDFALDAEQLATDNPINFTLHIDGKPHPVLLERIAVIEPSDQIVRKPSFDYDTPGTDVTSILKEYNIPMSLSYEQVSAYLSHLPKDKIKRLQELQLVNTPDDEAPLPLWSIVLRYHWTQTFAAGQNLIIEHSYTPAPAGGLILWEGGKKDVSGHQAKLISDYCIDNATQRALNKRLHVDESGSMLGDDLVVYLDYILTTANTWQGPIGTFHLTIDKGEKDNILSLCLDGLRKTGETKFEMTRSNFRPDKDLRLMIFAKPEQPKQP